MLYEFELLTDHFQFLLGDAELGPLVDTTRLWDIHSPVVSMPDAQELVGVATVRYGGTTKVQLEILRSPPGAAAGWQTLGMFTLAVPSGRLVVWAPESAAVDGGPSVWIEPGTYSGKAAATGTEEVADEMAQRGPDVYRCSLWPQG